MLKKAVVAVLALFACACAQLPKAELQAYQDAFRAAQTAATPLMADYAVGERAELRSRIEEQRNFADRGYFTTFEVSDAAALSTIGNPPGASALERGFSGIGRYNDTLVALAENRNIEVAKGQIRQMIGDLTSLAPQAAAMEIPFQNAANLVAEALRPAIAADNRREFQRIVLDGYPLVIQLIGELRNHTPTQFSTTTAPLRARWVREEQNREQLADQINGWHRAYADYVVLLNIMERSLTSLKEAVEHPREVPLLERASTGTSELRSYAEALRRSVAELHAPR